MTTTTLAAVAAAASALSDEAIAAAAANAAPPAAEAAPAAPVAGSITQASAPALSAGMALELASLALPSVRDQLTALAAAANADTATEASYRAACLDVARGGAKAADVKPLVTSAPDMTVAKLGEKQQAAIPPAHDLYAARAKSMAG